MAAHEYSIPYAATQLLLNDQDIPQHHGENPDGQPRQALSDAIFEVVSLPPAERRAAIEALPKEMKDRLMAWSTEFVATAREKLKGGRGPE